MGMFDNVKYKAKCWRCNNELDNFQTKDGENMLELITPKQIGIGTFYSMCDKCEAWNEWDIVPKEVDIIFNEKESKLRTKLKTNNPYNPKISQERENLIKKVEEGTDKAIKEFGDALRTLGEEDPKEKDVWLDLDTLLEDCKVIHFYDTIQYKQLVNFIKQNFVSLKEYEDILSEIKKVCEGELFNREQIREQIKKEILKEKYLDVSTWQQIGKDRGYFDYFGYVEKKELKN
jgi:hypothetical protein